MSERCPSSYNKPETPQEMFRDEMRGNLNEIIRNSENPFAIEIALKFGEILNIKERVDQFQKHKDDISVYQEWKRLGLFLVIDTESKINYQDEESGLDIKKGDKILDIHLPPANKEEATLVNLTNSMRLIAKYIEVQKLTPKYILGATFERLARISKRQGFEIIEPELPRAVKRGVERVYQQFGNRGLEQESMGRILLCYQTRKNFLERYLVKNK